MITQFLLQPNIGAIPVAFGATVQEVSTLLGDASRISRNFLGERDEQREGINVRYSKSDETVAEVSLLPNGLSVFYEDIDLFSGVDPIDILFRNDPKPFIWVGFIIFNKLGVAVTGYHDGDDSQRAITVFKAGRWDVYKSQFKKFKR